MCIGELCVIIVKIFDDAYNYDDLRIDDNKDSTTPSSFSSASFSSSSTVSASSTLLSSSESSFSLGLLQEGEVGSRLTLPEGSGLRRYRVSLSYLLYFFIVFCIVFICTIIVYVFLI